MSYLRLKLGANAPRQVVLDAALGQQQIFVREDQELRQLTFAQQGGFANPTFVGQLEISADAPYHATNGPEKVYSTARVKYRGKLASASGRAFILIGGGQSQGAGATGNFAGQTPAGSGAITLLPPMSTRLWMPNGGVTPQQGGLDSSIKNVLIDPSRYSSFVPAYEGANPDADRETQWMAMAEVLAANLPPEDDVIVFGFPVGSTEFSDLIFGFGVAWAANTAYEVNDVRRPPVLNGYKYVVVSVSGTGTSGAVGPTWSEDPEELIIDNAGANQVVWQLLGPETEAVPATNIKRVAAAAVDFALSRDKTPIILVYGHNGNEGNNDAIATANWKANLGQCRTWIDAELQPLTGQVDPILLLLPFTNYPRTSINHDPASNIIDAWTANTQYQVDDVVRAVTLPVDFQLRVVSISGTGTSGAVEPVWDDTLGNTTTDNAGANQVVFEAEALNPDTSHMGKVSNVQLGAEEYCRENTDALGYAQYHHFADSVTGAAHYSPSQEHRFNGELSGHKLVRYLATGERLHPYVVSAERIVTEREVTLTLSQAGQVDTTLVVPPPSYGIGYEDAAGIVDVTDPLTHVFSEGNTVLTVTLAEDPSGDGDEVLSVACNNADEFDPPDVSSYPYVNPNYGNGNTVGQRSNFRAVEQIGYSTSTGRPLYEYFPHQLINVNVYAAQLALKEIFEDIGLTMDLVLDFRDIRCCDGVSQIITDLAAVPHNYQFGSTSGVDAEDPTLVGVAGALDDSVYVQFGGNDALTPEASYTTFDHWHKADAQYVVGALYRTPSGLSNQQHLFSNVRDFSSSKLGFQFRLNTSGQPGLAVTDATGNASMFGRNLGGTTIFNAWAFAMMGINATTGVGWGLSTSLAGVPLEFDVDYANPGTGAPDSSGPAIGKSGTADLSPEYLANQARVACVFAGNTWYTASQMMPVYRSLQRIFPTI